MLPVVYMYDINNNIKLKINPGFMFPVVYMYDINNNIKLKINPRFSL